MKRLQQIWTTSLYVRLSNFATNFDCDTKIRIRELAYQFENYMMCELNAIETPKLDVRMTVVWLTNTKFKIANRFAR